MAKLKAIYCLSLCWLMFLCLHVTVLTFIWKNLVMMITKLLNLQVRLPPEVNRILYVKNLPYKITAEEMYDIFGKYGAIRQIRV